jgi:hypothetical protein
MELQIVGRVTESLFPYQGWPTVAKDGDGVLYAVSSGHRLGHVCPFGKNYLYVSADEGASWTGPIVANDTCMDDRDAGLCAWGKGNLLLTWFNHSPELYIQRAESRSPQNAQVRTPLAQAAIETWKTLPPEQCRRASYARLSRDGGKTWSEKVQIPLTSPHGPVKMTDGRLLFVGKERAWGEDLEAEAVYAMTSSDDGMSWDMMAPIPCPDGHTWDQIHEPHGIELADGTIIAALRVHDNNVPGRLLTFISRSVDGGKTFSQPVSVTLGAPPHLMQHSSGAVILSYSKRFIHPQGQCVRISRDSGATWSEDISVAPESPDWAHGYPSTVELSDGSLITVFYQKYPGDSHNSVLFTRWELES